MAYGQVYNMRHLRLARPTDRFRRQLDGSLAVQKIAQILFEHDRGGEYGCVNDLSTPERNRYYRHAEAALRRLDPNIMSSGATASAQAILDYDSEQPGNVPRYPALSSLSSRDQADYFMRAKRAITAYETHLQKGSES